MPIKQQAKSRTVKEAAGDDAASRQRAVALHQDGKIAEAAAMYESLLEAQPTDAGIMGLLAVAQLQLGNESEALATWQKALSIDAEAPTRLRVIANFLVAARQKRLPQLSRLAKNLVVPDWPQGSAPDAGERSMIVALADSLAQLDRKEAALRLLDTVLPVLGDDTELLNDAVQVMINAGGSKKAVAVLQPLTSVIGAVDGGLLTAHAVAAHAAGQIDDARRLSRRAIEAVPVHITEERPGQTLLIGVLNPAPVPIVRAGNAFHLHFSSNIPSVLAESMSEQYRFLSIFPEARSADRALAALPRPHIVLNNWVSEWPTASGKLELMADFADRLGVPVLNHPRNVALTSRQHNAERLAGIPDLVVPRVVRFLNEPKERKAVLRLIGEEVGYPVIIRGPTVRKGAAAKLDTQAELSSHLETLPNTRFYAIEYIHNPVSSGLYRKIRAAVIGSELFITHVHFGGQWSVHRERDREKLAALPVDSRETAFAERMIAQPEETLGAAAMAALREIRLRTPLDMFGIDFDMMPDGRMLFFEANAAMRLSMRDREGLEQTRARMRTALSQLFHKPPLPRA
jgi:tetratricopeptide (TPR) repeat protein